jgi:hypothetical protein
VNERERERERNKGDISRKKLIEEGKRRTQQVGRNEKRKLLTEGKVFFLLPTSDPYQNQHRRVE